MIAEKHAVVLPLVIAVTRGITLSLIMKRLIINWNLFMQLYFVFIYTSSCIPYIKHSFNFYLNFSPLRS